MSANVSTVISAGKGVILLRVTYVDEFGNDLPEQPPGRYQVWSVIGEVRMLHACSAWEDAITWMKIEGWHLLEEIPQQFLDDAFSSETTASHQVIPCRIELLDLGGNLRPSRQQLTRKKWMCVPAEPPRIVSGFDLTDDRRDDAVPSSRSRSRPR